MTICPIVIRRGKTGRDQAWRGEAWSGSAGYGEVSFLKFDATAITPWQTPEESGTGDNHGRRIESR